MATLETRDDFQTKRDVALRLIATKGIWSWRATPLIYHVYWACGLRIRPPLFSSFLFNFTYHACLGAIFIGFAALFLGFTGKLDSFNRPIIVVVVVAGVMLLGLMGAFEFRYLARKYNLPSWSELKSEAQIFE
jgi:hypothetical protein